MGQARIIHHKKKKLKGNAPEDITKPFSGKCGSEQRKSKMEKAYKEEYILPRFDLIGSKLCKIMKVVNKRE